MRYTHPDEVALASIYADGIIYKLCMFICLTASVHRVVHGSDGPAGRVGSGHDFAEFWWVGSGRVSTSDLLVFY